jgi:hypothetical protein
MYLTPILCVITLLLSWWVCCLSIAFVVLYLLPNCFTHFLTFGEQICLVYYRLSSLVCIMVSSSIFWSFQTRVVSLWARTYRHRRPHNRLFINQFVITVDCLVPTESINIDDQNWGLPLPTAIVPSVKPLWFPRPTTLLTWLSPFCPSCNDTTIVAGYYILCFSISIIFLFARDNWRYRHNPSMRELVCLM